MLTEFGAYYRRSKIDKKGARQRLAQSIAELIADSADTLKQSGVPESRLDALTLMCHVLGRDRTFVITHGEELLSDYEALRYQELVERRSQGEPLQYITGHQEFFGLDFVVTEAVLIPRPETELLVETALDLIGRMPGMPGMPVVCDVGTGSGCIAVAILHNAHNARGLAIDVSPEALVVAQKNASNHRVEERLAFLLSDCFDNVEKKEQFDLVLSNPPYVAQDDLSGLQREVRDHEPLVALTPGGDGLAIIRKLLTDTPQVLRRGGHLLLEIGFDQHERVTQLIQPGVWKLLHFHRDLQGIPRTVALQRL